MQKHRNSLKTPSENRGKSEHSARMACVKSTNTSQELIIRRALHREGYRYRLHSRDLPGSPDVVFTRRRKVIFVHGCFWHRHSGCHLASTPRSNTLFWNAKFEATIKRDAAQRRKLKRLGWGVLVIWQCQLKDLDQVLSRTRAFLSQPSVAIR